MWPKTLGKSKAEMIAPTHAGEGTLASLLHISDGAKLNYIENSGFRHKIYLPLRELLYTTATGFRLATAIIGRPNGFVNADAALVVEGFMRSANTFVEAALVLSQGESFKFSHHGHHFIHVKEALRRNKPCVVLFRKPEQVITSLVDFGTPDDIGQICAQYTSYYRRVLRLRNSILLVEFNEVTSDFGAVVERINNRFGMALRVPKKNEITRQGTYALIPKIHKRPHGMIRESPLEDAQFIAQRKQQMVRIGVRVAANPKLAACETIYQETLAEWRRQCAAN